jgi:hypothetical protein
LFFGAKLYSVIASKDACLDRDNVGACLAAANKADATYKEYTKKIEENSKKATKYKEAFCTLSGLPKTCKSSELNFIQPNL